MADVKWIKITTDIFDDEKILLIESLPDPYAIITCWFKLLCLAGKQNNSGVFMMGRIAYTDKMLATIFRMNEATVTMALKTFEQFGMIEIVDGVITIPNWNKHQSLDAYEKKKAYDRKYRLEQREKQRLLAAQSNDNRTDSRTTVVVPDKELEKDKELDIDIEKEERVCDSSESKAPVLLDNPRVFSQYVKTSVDCQEIVDLYHSICKSYPTVRSLSDSRRKAIKARLRTYALDDFKTLFENAEASSFLKGSNDRNWSANFDWLIKDSNMAKVLEGNYVDKPKRFGRKEAIPGWMGKRELDADELEAINRLMEEPEQKTTLGNNPDLAARAEKLKQQLQG